jgi:hypothetical protein
MIGLYEEEIEDVNKLVDNIIINVQNIVETLSEEGKLYVKDNLNEAMEYILR